MNRCPFPVLGHHPFHQPDVFFHVKADPILSADCVVLLWDININHLNNLAHFYCDNRSDLSPLPKKTIADIYQKDKEMFLQEENNVSHND